MAAYTVAAWQDQHSPDEYARFVANELTSGVADVESLRRLLRRIDDIHRQDVDKVHATYVAGGLARLVVPIRNLEAEISKTPEWTRGFLDLTGRLREQPHVANAVLRTLDLRLAQRLGSDRSVEKVQALWSLNKDAVERMATTIELFIIGVWGVPDRFFQPPTTATNRSPAPAAQSAPGATSVSDGSAASDGTLGSASQNGASDTAGSSAKPDEAVLRLS